MRRTLSSGTQVQQLQQGACLAAQEESPPKRRRMRRANSVAVYVTASTREPYEDAAMPTLPTKGAQRRLSASADCSLEHEKYYDCNQQQLVDVSPSGQVCSTACVVAADEAEGGSTHGSPQLFGTPLLELSGASGAQLLAAPAGGDDAASVSPGSGCDRDELPSAALAHRAHGFAGAVYEAAAASSDSTPCRMPPEQAGTPLMAGCPGSRGPWLPDRTALARPSLKKSGRRRRSSIEVLIELYERSPGLHISSPALQLGGHHGGAPSAPRSAALLQQSAAGATAAETAVADAADDADRATGHAAPALGGNAAAAGGQASPGPALQPASPQRPAHRHRRKAARVPMRLLRQLPPVQGLGSSPLMPPRPAGTPLSARRGSPLDTPLADSTNQRPPGLFGAIRNLLLGSARKAPLPHKENAAADAAPDAAPASASPWPRLAGRGGDAAVSLSPLTLQEAGSRGAAAPGGTPGGAAAAGTPSVRACPAPSSHKLDAIADLVQSLVPYDDGDGSPPSAAPRPLSSSVRAGADAGAAPLEALCAAASPPEAADAGRGSDAMTELEATQLLSEMAAAQGVRGAAPAPAGPCDVGCGDGGAGGQDAHMPMRRSLYSAADGAAPRSEEARRKVTFHLPRAPKVYEYSAFSFNAAKTPPPHARLGGGSLASKYRGLSPSPMAWGSQQQLGLMFAAYRSAPGGGAGANACSLLPIPRILKYERRRKNSVLPPQASLVDPLEQQFREAYINLKLATKLAEGNAWAGIDFDGLDLAQRSHPQLQQCWREVSVKLMAAKGTDATQQLKALVDREWQQISAIRRRASLVGTSDAHAPAGAPKPILKRVPALLAGMTGTATEGGGSGGGALPREDATTSERPRTSVCKQLDMNVPLPGAGSREGGERGEDGSGGPASPCGVRDAAAQRLPESAGGPLAMQVVSAPGGGIATAACKDCSIAVAAAVRSEGLGVDAAGLQSCC